MAEETRKPTLMKQFETDEDLDDYVIEHAKYFTVIQIRPGGFVNGYGSNYIREEVPTLEEAMERAKELYEQTKKKLLIYAVADFAGAIGFNRPVRQYPPNTYRSKADKARDERKARAARKAERAAKKAEPKAAVFKTSFDEDDFMTSKKAKARVIRS